MKQYMRQLMEEGEHLARKGRAVVYVYHGKLIVIQTKTRHFLLGDAALKDVHSSILDHGSASLGPLSS
jgi:hypothetical protein